jgi:hypothetical protein
MIDRLIAIINSLPVRSRFITLEKESGIDRQRWSHIYHKRVIARIEEIEAMIKIFPEYAYWLTTGKTAPEIGQTNPNLGKLIDITKKPIIKNERLQRPEISPSP